jgi:hypothetical protein
MQNEAQLRTAVFALAAWAVAAFAGFILIVWQVAYVNDTLGVRSVAPGSIADSRGGTELRELAWETTWNHRDELLALTTTVKVHVPNPHRAHVGSSSQSAPNLPNLNHGGISFASCRIPVSWEPHILVETASGTLVRIVDLDRELRKDLRQHPPRDAPDAESLVEKALKPHVQLWDHESTAPDAADRPDSAGNRELSPAD